MQIARALAGPARPQSPHTEMGFDDLRQEAIASVSLVVAVAGAAAAWLTLPGVDFQPGRWLAFLALCAGAIAVYLLCRRSPVLAQTVLLIAPIVSLALALRYVSSPVVPFFAVIAVMANAVVSPANGFASALLSTLVILVLPPAPEVAIPAIVLLWLVAVVQWISARGLYTVVQWAWFSHQRATTLLEESRDRQQQLNATLKSLTEATTRLQRFSRELAAARRRAEEARELKEHFAANISHELRTPLSVILGFSELMYYSPDIYGDMAWPATLRRDVQQIYKSSRLLFDLVNDVMDLARIDAAQMPIHKEPSDLNETVNEAIETVRDLVRQGDVQLRAELPNGLPIISFDRTRIRQVLLNLLNNAVRFTEHGTISVSVSLAEDSVVVCVSDTGAGIAPDKLVHIFDEYYQGDMTLRRKKGGAGLGLAICKRFVELHGGRIWVESTAGKGSSFYFSLPQYETAVPSRLPPAAGDQDASAERPCMVVVEDDLSVGALLQRALKGYRVLLAGDLPEALRLVRDWHPRAVVLNRAPGGDDGCLADFQRSLPPDVPVVTCVLPSQSWMALQAGVAAVLNKPLDRRRLLKALGPSEEIHDVLIVDDDAGFVQLVSRYLQDSGLAISWAGTAAEATRMIAECTPHTILLDLMLPDGNGLQVLRGMPAPEGAEAPRVFLVTSGDYSEDMLTQHEGALKISRRRGYNTTETISYLQALLDATETRYPADSEPAQPATASG